MIVVAGTNEVITFSSSQSTTDYVYSSSQSSTAYTAVEKFPFGVAHTYGFTSEDSYGYSTYPYGFVEHTLKEGTIHVS